MFGSTYYMTTIPYAPFYTPSNPHAYVWEILSRTPYPEYAARLHLTTLTGAIRRLLLPLPRPAQKTPYRWRSRW